MPSKRRSLALAPDEDTGGSDLCQADLRRRDLSGRDLTGARLIGADLRWANLSQARAASANFSGARLRRAVLVEAELCNAVLREADLTDANLRQADLTNADLTAALLDFASLEGATLVRARMPQLGLSRVNLRRALLREADLRGATLTDGELVDADLGGAVLAGADISFADLQGASLANADLRGTNLSGANLDRADLRGARIEGARFSWVHGLDRKARQDLLARGARVPASWLACRWAAFNALAHRHPGPLYLVGIAVILVVAVAAAVWAARETHRDRLFVLNPPGSGVLFEIDCGGKRDDPYQGRAGHIGGQAAPPAVPASTIQRVALAPAKVYLTERRGSAFSYRFHTGRGWYEIELHFVELEHRRRGERVFDVRVEGETVLRDFDILSEAYPETVLVRRVAVWVDDGNLEIELARRRGLAKVNFIRVRRLDAPADYRPQRGDP